MNRLFALLIAAAMVWGCRAPTPTFDPFQGPPRIPPPGTGQVGQIAPPADSYYSSQPSVHPGQPAASATAPARYAPRDGSYQFRSGAVERDDGGRVAEAGGGGQGPGVREEETSRPRSARLASTRLESSRASEQTAVTTAEFEQDTAERHSERESVRQAANWEHGATEKPARYDAKIRVVEPAARAEEPPPTDPIREPARFEPDGPVTEISNLPKSRAAAPARPPRAIIRAASDRPTARSEAVDTAAPVTSRFATNTRSTATPAPSASRKLYGYDPEYRSLQGRLEFSESERRWKLRYIPIDGQTDKFGGSVILADAPELDGFKAGDYVTVEGTVGQKDPRSRSFAPNYQLDRISRAQ